MFQGRSKEKQLTQKILNLQSSNLFMTNVTFFFFRIEALMNLCMSQDPVIITTFVQI